MRWGSWLFHPASLRAVVLRAEVVEMWESRTKVFFDDGSCVICLILFLFFAVSRCFCVRACVCAPCRLCVCIRGWICACGWVRRAGSTGPDWSLTDYYVSDDYYYWVLRMKSQFILPEDWSLVTGLSSNHAVMLWKPDMAAIMLSILCRFFVVYSFVIKRSIIQTLTLHLHVGMR